MPVRVGKKEGYKATLLFSKAKDFPFDNDRVYCIINEDDISHEVLELLKKHGKNDPFRVDLCL